MSTAPRMGRGLDALLGGAEHGSYKNSNKASTLELNNIFPNPNQPRKYFSDESLAELAASISEQGIIQPILVRPIVSEGGYEIVAGERRFRAAKLAGLKEVPVYIKDLDDAAVMAAALIENIQREDLSPIEEANALNRLREECGITQEELATRLGKSRSAIANSLRLLQLSKNAQEDLQAGSISAGHARAILSLASDIAAQENLRIAIHDKALSVRDTEAAVQSFKENSEFPWEANLTEQASSEAENPQENLIETNTKASSRTKPVYLQEMQKKIKSTTTLKTSISGTEERGRVTLTYTNADELSKILQLMAVAE